MILYYTAVVNRGNTKQPAPPAPPPAAYDTIARAEHRTGSRRSADDHPPLLIGLLAAPPDVEAGRPFAIEVVDDATGRGVPLVELRTVNEIRLVTDSNGVAALSRAGADGRPAGLLPRVEPRLRVPQGRLRLPRQGAAGPRRASRRRLKIRRINIAERLYRVTGGGIYRDSVLVGRAVPIRAPVLNAQVFGSDSVVNAVYRGKIYWFWGDTNRPGYPLGNFHVPGATSRLPADGGLDPGRGVDLDYFVGARRLRPADRPDARARARPGSAAWSSSTTRLATRAIASGCSPATAKIRPPMETYERGLVEFNPETNTFEKAATYPLDAPNYPTGQAFLHTVGGVEYVYFATAYPLIRVRAEPEALKHPERFEAFTCLAPGQPPDRPRVDRGDDGSPRWAWTRDAAAITPAVQAKLIKDGTLKPEEALLHLRDAETGKPLSGAQRLGLLERLPPALGDDRLRGGRDVVPGRDLVRRGRHPARPLGLRPQGRHPRQVQLLQPQAAPDVRPGRRPADLLRGDLHAHLLGQRRPDPAVRLQPDHVPARPGRPPAQPAGRRSTAWPAAAWALAAARPGRHPPPGRLLRPRSPGRRGACRSSRRRPTTAAACLEVGKPRARRRGRTPPLPRPPRRRRRPARDDRPALRPRDAPTARSWAMPPRTIPSRTPPGPRRSGRPICRVWKNPLGVALPASETVGDFEKKRVARIRSPICASALRGQRAPLPWPGSAAAKPRSIGSWSFCHRPPELLHHIPHLQYNGADGEQRSQRGVIGQAIATVAFDCTASTTSGGTRGRQARRRVADAAIERI